MLSDHPEFEGFPKQTIKFLKGLRKNNNKEWFTKHRAAYDEYYVPVAKAFAAEMGTALKKISPDVNCEPRVGGSLFRINRDIRFSKDKTPYKPHMDMWFWEGGTKSMETTGFFFRLAGTHVIRGAGIHCFSKEGRSRFLDAVDSTEGSKLARAIAKLEKSGFVVGGDKLKRVPREYDADHELGELLKHKGLHVSREIPHSGDLHSKKFIVECVKDYRAMWPVSRWFVENVLLP
ncbi:MAG: DUF2461 domain-containing protein [Planctomycetes bacterium]|nr:DUF2461 domain-containing protein [Planctomycetota bacterium]